MSNNKFDKVNNQVDFISLEHEMLKKWDEENTFERLRSKNEGNKTWSFMDGPITANNPMGVHHAWGRTLKDVFQRYHAMKGYDLRYQMVLIAKDYGLKLKSKKNSVLNLKEMLKILELKNLFNCVRIELQNIQKFKQNNLKD